MRTRCAVALLGLAMLAGMACEAEHGKGGFIDRAVAKDLREMAPHPCPKGMDWGLDPMGPPDCVEEGNPYPECKAGCFKSNE